MSAGILYVVATPIGNLEDITLRALRVLKEVDVIFAEDTRVTKKLLSRYDIATPLERLDAEVESQKTSKVIQFLEEGKDIALVSDAGTPTISDPGSRVVAGVRVAGFTVVAIPGPSALTAALSVAGVPADDFVFLGFPPHKKGREKFFKEIADEKRTVVFYESTHRIIKTLTQLDDSLREGGQARELSDRKVIVARELTKIHEEIVSDFARGMIEYFQKHPEKQRGEFVIIVSER